eukprot:6207291-Pleurochrysis_carterae.AAC.2
MRAWRGCVMRNISSLDCCLACDLEPCLQHHFRINATLLSGRVPRRQSAVCCIEGTTCSPSAPYQHKAWLLRVSRRKPVNCPVLCVDKKSARASSCTELTL